jgi:hypothetical protein
MEKLYNIDPPSQGESYYIASFRGRDGYYGWKQLYNTGRIKPKTLYRQWLLFHQERGM